MDQQSEELRSVLASYLPDRQIITFKQDMVVYSGKGERSRFQGAKVVSYFVHEWTHYLHNVSTIHGVSAFSSLIGLWNAFRFTTDEVGIGQGVFTGATAEQLKTTAYIATLDTTRRPASRPLPSNAQIERYRVVACKPVSNAYGITDRIDVTVEESNDAGDTTNYQTTVGPTEILESVAYLLETRLIVDAFGQEPSTACVFPYHSLTLLAKHLAPSLCEKEVLLCGLASLQSTYPADAVFMLLRKH